jgi:hypothetical protein
VLINAVKKTEVYNNVIEVVTEKFRAEQDEIEEMA